MANDYGTPVSQRAMRAIYIGGALGVGLLTGAAFAWLSATGWDDTSPSPRVAIVVGFVVGTLSIVVSVLMRRRRSHEGRRPPRGMSGWFLGRLSCQQVALEVLC